MIRKLALYIRAKFRETSVRRSFLLLIATLFAVAAPAFAASADDWPDRPIRTLTTTSPGGISDVFMRALAEKLGPRLGKPIVIENRPGGMQNIGARACQDSAPDGYTICIINADPMIYNQFLIKEMPFDPDAQHLSNRDLDKMAEQAREAARDGRMDEAQQRMAELERMLDKLRNARAEHDRDGERTQGQRKRGRQQMGAVQDIIGRQGGVLDHTQGRADETTRFHGEQPGTKPNPGKRVSVSAIKSQ